MRDKLHTDKQLLDSNWILNKIQGESRYQVVKWGIQTHDLFEWLTYTAEELGELAKEISEYLYRFGDEGKIEREAIQLATLAIKIAEMCDPFVGEVAKENH